MVDPACEINDKGAREKNEGNQTSLLSENEKTEVASDEDSCVKEDWNEH